MTDDMSSKLDEFFNARSEKKAEVDRENREREAVRQENLQAFLALIESLIRPALESFAGMLRDKGKQTSIYEYKDGEWVGSGPRPQTIGIRFLVRGTQAFGFPDPYFAVSVDKNIRRVNIFSSSAPRGSSTPSFEDSMVFEELTVELINEKLFTVVTDAYK